MWLTTVLHQNSDSESTIHNERVFAIDSFPLGVNSPFRVKRKRALAKLGLSKADKGLDGDDLGDLDLMMGDTDFDAEAFLDVKPENLEQADIFSGANASLMEKYIKVLSFEQ